MKWVELVCPRPSEPSSGWAGSNKPDHWAALIRTEHVLIWGAGPGREATSLRGTCQAVLLLTAAGCLPRQGGNECSEHAREQSACCLVCGALCWAKDTEINQTPSYPHRTARSSAAGGCGRGWEEVAGDSPLAQIRMLLLSEGHREGVHGPHLHLSLPHGMALSSTSSECSVLR